MSNDIVIKLFLFSLCDLLDSITIRTLPSFKFVAIISLVLTFTHQSLSPNYSTYLTYLSTHFTTDSSLWKRFCNGITRHMVPIWEGRHGANCRCWHNQLNLFPHRSLQWLYVCYCYGFLDSKCSPKFHSYLIFTHFLHWIPFGRCPLFDHFFSYIFVYLLSGPSIIWKF